jgi:oxygen-independent coproporphyrinogen-3 oxidase
MKKCHYCNFFSLPYSEDLATRYIEALRTEMRNRLPASSSPITIYIGGGTPTVLSEDVLSGMMQAMSSSIDRSRLTEFTVEINPGTLTDEKVDILTGTGVNRISLGVQSFDDEKLHMLGRAHSASEAVKAFEKLSSVGFDNVGIDLIYGVPGDSVSAWLQDLKQAADLHPQHISIYCLSVEPGTVFERKIQSGELARPDENLQRELYYRTVDFLTVQDYEHYEISNFALLGFRSRHNEATWNYEPYIGLGPSAASFNGEIRERNSAELENYCTNPGIPVESEKLNQTQKAREVIMLALRTCQGLTGKQFSDRTGLDLEEIYGNKIDELKNRHLLEEVPGIGALRLTREALFVSDEVLVEFF